MRADRVTGVTRYVSQFQVYVGQEGSSETGLGGRVVTITLVKKNYHVCCDNVLTSVNLFHQLHYDGVYTDDT